MASHLQMWTNKFNELREGQPKTEDTGSGDSSKDDDPPSRSYGDTNRMCCYLCSRQFKTAAEVNKHERMSQLHRDNLNNQELVTKAVAKLEKAGIKIIEAQTDGTDVQNEYRDRARERRQHHGQTKSQAHKDQVQKSKKQQAGLPSNPKPSSESESAPDSFQRR